MSLASRPRPLPRGFASAARANTLGKAWNTKRAPQSASDAAALPCAGNGIGAKEVG